MTNVSSLSKAARELVVSRALPILGQPDLTRGDQARWLVEDLEQIAQRDPDAGEAMDVFLLNGAAEFLKAFQKQEVGTVASRQTGRTLAIPSRYGRPVYDEQTGRVIGYQMPLWYELPWEEFLALITDLERKAGRLETVSEIFRAVARLQDEFPDSQTPAEACARKGIDPRSFNVDLGQVS